MNLMKFVVVKATRLFLWIYVFWLNLWEYNASYKKLRKLPPIKSVFCKNSVVELRDFLKTKQITSKRLTEQYIARIEDVNKILNSVVDERFEAALEEAEKIDKLISSTNDLEKLYREKPLLGIPFTVKENLAVKGLKHSSARTRVPVQIASEDSVAVGRMRAAGAIPLLVSNAPELCLNLETVSKHGRTLNPYDSTKSTGGSSGGEGSLLGAGASAIGLASDIAGSIRIPAMLCGVFGHKPTPGFVSVEGHIPSSNDPMWDYYFTVGPMVKRAVDLPLLLKVLVPEEKHSVLRLNEQVDITKLKIYYMFGEGSTSYTQTPPSDRVKEALIKAVDRLKTEYKCECQEVDLPYMVDAINYNQVIVTMKGVENVFQRSDDPDDWDFLRMLEMFIRKMTFTTDANFGALLWGPMAYFSRFASSNSGNDIELQLKNVKQQFTDMLGDNAIFLYPSFSVETQSHNELSKYAFDVAYSSVFNVLGMPSTQCPINVKGGLPVGVQVVAAPERDRLCFAVAAALEATCGGWVPPEDYESFI